MFPNEPFEEVIRMGTELFGHSVRQLPCAQCRSRNSANFTVSGSFILQLNLVSVGNGAHASSRRACFPSTGARPVRPVESRIARLLRYHAATARFTASGRPRAAYYFPAAANNGVAEIIL